MNRDIKITFTEKELVTIKFNQIDRAITADLAGDVTGSPSDNTVVKIRNKTIDAPVAGDDAKVITYDETNDKYVLSANASSDEKSKVSANDTTAGYLNGKLVAGTGITLTEIGDGGDETLSIINSDKGSDAISAHEITYDHTELHAHANKALLDTYTQTEVDIADAISKEHTRSHTIDSTSDHTSTITENNLMDADSNGLPDDSGLAVSDVSDAITKKHTQNTDQYLDYGGANQISIPEIVKRNTAYTAYYVSTTGSDVTGDGSSGNPFATIAHPLSLVPRFLDYYVEIIVKDGTYTESLTIGSPEIYAKSFDGSGGISIYSESFDADKVTINSTDNILYIYAALCEVYIGYISFEVQTNGKGCIRAHNCRYAYIDNCKFGDNGKVNTHGIENWTSTGLFVKDCSDIGANKVTLGIVALGSITHIISGSPFGDTYTYLQTGGIVNTDILLNVVEDTTPQLGGNLDCTSYKLTNLAVPASAGDSIRQTTKITEANLEDAIDKRNKVDTYTIGATGCDYTTVQSALDAQNSGGELFIVYPGTYTDDTIAFTANNQTIKGIGEQCCALITTADANIVDFGAYTGCCIHHIKITLTAPDSNVDMITGTTGDLKLRYCDLEVTVGNVVNSIAQPSAINVTGAGNVEMWFGTMVYNSTNSYASCVKALVLLNTGTTVQLNRVTITMTCSGTAEVTIPVYGTSTGEINMYKCEVDIVDNDASYTVGLAYLSYSGTDEFENNIVRVTNNTNAALGIWLNASVGETTVFRTMYNHFHILSSGGLAYSARLVNVRCTWNSQFDDIIAANGYLSSGTITMVSSEADGNLTVTGLSIYANNAAAISGGLTVGAFYRTGADPDLVCVVH